MSGGDVTGDLCFNSYQRGLYWVRDAGRHVLRDVESEGLQDRLVREVLCSSQHLHDDWHPVPKFGLVENAGSCTRF
jgi:hypothetical protein